MDIYNKKCEYCGKELHQKPYECTTTFLKRKYCDRRCSKFASRKPLTVLRTVVCKICGEAFKTVAYNAKYCRKCNENRNGVK